MGTPITWRNVDAPNPALAAQPIQAAGNSINAGFDIFSKLIQQKQAMDAANLVAVDEGNKQAYLDRLQQAKTPEEVAALQASGELDKLSQGLSASARAAIRGAGEARLTSTRQGAIAGNTYNDQQAAYAAKPLADRIAMLTARGEFDMADAILSDNPGMPGRAALSNAITIARRTQVTQAREDAAATDAATLRQYSLADARQRDIDNKRGVLDRGAEEVLTGEADRAAATWRQRVGTAKAQIDTVAAGMGMPMKDGSLDLTRVDTAMRARLNAELQSRGAPPLETIEKGDTAAASSFLESVRNTGAYKPEQIAKIEARLPSLFSTVKAPLVGNDKEAADRQIRIEDALAAENEIKFGVVATPKTVAGLSDAASAVVNEVTKDGSWRREALREVVNEFLQSGGIKEGDQRVLPSAETLKQIIRGTKNGFFGTNTSEVRDALEAWKNRTESLNAAKEVVRARTVQTLRAVNQAPPR